MKVNITQKLIIYFVLILFISLILTSFISNYMIDEKFDTYLKNEHHKKVEKIESIIQSAFSQNSLYPDFDKEGLGKYVALEGYFVEIKDINNHLIYTSNRMNSKGFGHMMGFGGMKKNFRNLQSNYVEESYPLSINNKSIGTMTIGYFGPSNLSMEALVFKKALYHSILLSSIISMAISFFIIFGVSKQLALPIKEITSVAKKISTGSLSIKSDVHTNIEELIDLSYSIQDLSATLKAQDALRKRLISDISHEIRTPINNIQNTIEAFIDGIYEPTHDRLNESHEEIIRLTNLVKNLENVIHLDKGNYVLNKTYFDLNDEIKKIIHTLIPQFHKKHIKLIYESSVHLEVNMDKDKFKQILYNLLINGYKYSKENSIVHVISKIKENCLVITIEDFGIGIPPKDLPHIFEYLYREDTSRTKSTGGSGIGLSITKSLVESHGGKIEAFSEINKGSLFKITFPLKNISKNM